MKIWTIPNILTLLRIISIPVFVLLFFLHYPYSSYVVAAIFLLAAITDWFDGFLARQLKQISPFGEFLDPVADKLMIAAALILLVVAYPTWWMSLASIVIVSRKIVVSALREWMAELGKRATVKVSFIGKVKTAVQMIAILLILSQQPYYNWLAIIGLVLLWVAVILTLWSMCIYLKAAWASIKATD